jgi:hypothetical protein
MDPPAQDPAIFVIDLKDATKKPFFCFLLFEGTFTSGVKDKKKSQIGRNQGFSYCFA